MKPIIVLVHGYNTRGQLFYSRLAPALRALGFVVQKFHYGNASLWDVYVANDNIAETLACYLRAFDQPVIPIGHSNGCALIHTATCFLDAPENVNRAIYYSPALERHLCTSSILEKVLVFHTRSDWAVRAATYLPFIKWGRMGAFGPSPEAKNYVTVDGYPVVKGHSGWFSDTGHTFSFPHTSAFLQEAACHG